MREIVLKIETTGLVFEQGNKIIEIAAIELVNHIATGKYYHQIINPNIDNHLTTKSLKDFPTFAQIAYDFVTFIGSDVIVGHNISYDIGFINNELKELGYSGYDKENMIDTLEMFNEKYPKWHNTLYHLCKRFHICENIKTDTIRKSSPMQIAEIEVQVYTILLQKIGVLKNNKDKDLG